MSHAPTAEQHAIIDAYRTGEDILAATTHPQGAAMGRHDLTEGMLPGADWLAISADDDLVVVDVAGVRLTVTRDDRGQPVAVVVDDLHARLPGCHYTRTPDIEAAPGAVAA